MEIRTPRLILRTARPDDLEAMHAVLSDPRATVWWSTPPHETLDQTRDWLDASIRLLQRLGFVRTGFGERTWNVGGVWKDSLYFALSRADRAMMATGQAPA